jgi:hypothetical protein
MPLKLPQKRADRRAFAAFAGKFSATQHRNRRAPCASADGTLIESESHRMGSGFA